MNILISYVPLYNLGIELADFSDFDIQSVLFSEFAIKHQKISVKISAKM
jgi:hypothetical protein